MYKTMLPFVVALSVGMISLTSSAAEQPMKADNQAVNTACATDAKTAGCGADKVGDGLMKCLHTYKKANKTFKFSDACMAAMKQKHADKKAGK